MKHKHWNIQSLVSSFFSFLLALLFLILSVCIGLGIGVFNTKSIVTSINRSDYLNKAFDDIYASTEMILSEAGLPEDLLSEVITLEKVYVGGMNYIEAATNKMDPQLNLDNIRQDIIGHIERYIELENIKQSDHMSGGILEAATAIEYQYKSAISLRFIEYLMDYKENYNRTMMIMIPSLLLLIALLCYFLIRMHRYRHRGVRYISYALFAASAMQLIPALYILFTKAYRDMGITPKYYNDFISNYLRQNILLFVYIGVIGSILAMVAVSLIGYMKNRSNG